MKKLKIGNIYKLKHNKVFCVSIQEFVMFTDNVWVKVEHVYEQYTYFGHIVNKFGEENPLCEIQFSLHDVYEDNRFTDGNDLCKSIFGIPSDPWERYNMFDINNFN